MEKLGIAIQIVNYEKKWNSSESKYYGKYNGFRFGEFIEIYNTIKKKIEEDPGFLEEKKNKPISNWIEKQETSVDEKESELNKIKRLTKKVQSELEKLKQPSKDIFTDVSDKEASESPSIPPPESVDVNGTAACGPGGCTVSGGKTKNKRSKKKTRRKRTNKKTRRNRRRR